MLFMAPPVARLLKTAHLRRYGARSWTFLSSLQFFSNPLERRAIDRNTYF
jgi:hypothetical protein